MNSPARSPIRPAAGFSLVEIMVALLVSLFLLAGVLQLYLGNQQTSRLGTGVGDLQKIETVIRGGRLYRVSDLVRLTAGTSSGASGWGGAEWHPDHP